MADIELVIKIPEEMYKASQILDVKYEDTVQIPLEVIANATPHETVTEFADRCGECGSSIVGKYVKAVLDKIRAEIIDTGAYEQEVNGKTEFLKGIDYCLGVIDKYRAESEDNE